MQFYQNLSINVGAKGMTYFSKKKTHLDQEPTMPKRQFVQDTVKILKIGTPKIITIIVLQLEQLDFTVQ